MADAAKRLAKRQRIAQLRAELPYVSQEALSAISVEAQRGNLLACSRKDIRIGRDADVSTDTPYGKLRTTIDAPQVDSSEPPLKIEIQNPFAMLWYAVTVSAAFNSMIGAALQRTPCTFEHPWRLLIYNDESSPGNQLAFKNARKLQGIYWTILELGIAALSNEDCWFEACFSQVNDVENIAGGISMLLALIITYMFSKTGGRNFATSGVCVTLNTGAVVTLFLSFAIVIADEAALHAIFESKGASGLKCCPLCINCYDGNNFRNIVESAHPGDAVLHTCSEFCKLVFLTPTVLDAIMARLRAAHATMGQDTRTRVVSLRVVAAAQPHMCLRFIAFARRRAVARRVGNGCNHAHRAITGARVLAGRIQRLGDQLGMEL